jgi:hypothetical protein
MEAPLALKNRAKALLNDTWVNTQLLVFWFKFRNILLCSRIQLCHTLITLAEPAISGSPNAVPTELNQTLVASVRFHLGLEFLFI